jgi:hypothetical protein
VRELHVRDDRGNEDQVARPVADHLICDAQTAKASDLNGPTVQHLARAKRFQALGHAIERIVCRRCHRDTHPRHKSLSEIQAANHHLAATRLRQLLRSVRGDRNARCYFMAGF